MDDWSETCDIFFELSNEDRLRILFHITQKPDNITTIAKSLELSTQEVSRHVSRLIEQKIAKRDTQGNILIEGFGKIILSELPYCRFFSKHREYFNNHPLVDIPREYISRMHELKDSIIVSDPMTVFQRIKLMCDQAEEYIYRLTDQRLNMIYENVQSAVDRGIEFRLIEPKNYKPSPGSETNPRVSPSKTRTLDIIPVFLAFSDKEVAGISFPLENGMFDYHGFSSKDVKAVKWCRDVYEYYWEKAEPF